MGWANCGTDSQGRAIGYAHEATCDHPGCDAKIHRGLAYACGIMHGEDEWSCEKYFCEKHKTYVSFHPKDAEIAGVTGMFLCSVCAERYYETDNGKFMLMKDGL